MNSSTSCPSFYITFFFKLITLYFVRAFNNNANNNYTNSTRVTLQMSDLKRWMSSRRYFRWTAAHPAPPCMLLSCFNSLLCTLFMILTTMIIIIITIILSAGHYKHQTSEPAWVKRKILSMNSSTSCPSLSLKYSATVRPVRATRARAPGGSFIWP